MSLLKAQSHEFSFVDGFGDDIRDARDYGFSGRAFQLLRERHPDVVAVHYLVDGLNKIYARGDNGKIFFLRDVPKGSEFKVLDDLDLSAWAGRQVTNKQYRQQVAAGMNAHKEQEQKEYVEAALNACDPEEAAFIIRRWKSQVMNEGTMFPTVSVPSNLSI